MAKATYGVSELDQKLNDIILGRVTDTAEIAQVLTQVDDSKFVDALNYLDGAVLAEIMDKLPTTKRQLIADYAKVSEMARNIHQENEVWKVSAEEYVKNSENLEKWKVDLKGEEFKSAREVVDWMNVSEDAKQVLMDTAARKVKEESRNVKGLTEKQYKDAINYEIQVAVYMATTATAALKEGTNPKVATQEAVNKFVAEGNKKNTLDVSVDAIAAYAATTHEWIEHRKEQAKLAFGATKFGKQVEKITAATAKELKAWDEALSKNKTIGKAYKVARKVAPVIGKMARGMAIGAGMLAVAHMAPAGMAVYAAYAVATSTKPLLEEYKKEKAQAAAKGQTLGFSAFASQNKIEVIRRSVMAANMIVSGVVGYGALGLNNLTTRGAIAGGMGILNALAIHHGDEKAAAAAAANPNGSTNAPKANWARAIIRGMGNSVVGFVAGWALRAGHDYFNGEGGQTVAEKTDEQLDMPGEAPHDSTNVEDSTQVAAVDSTEIKAKACGLDVQKYETLDAMLKSDCGCDENGSGAVNANDCEAKIKIQEKAPETAADLNFWASRAKMFVEDCEQQDLDILVEAGKINLADFPGINTMDEFAYKFGLMRKMNLPNQRPLVEEIERMIKQVQDIRCDESITGSRVPELMKMEPMHPDFAKDVANGMNSYDNRGHYLCDEPKPQVHQTVKPSVAPVVTEVEPVVVDVQDPEMEPMETPVAVAEPEVRTIAFEDGEKAPQVVGKDYRNVSLDYKPGEVHSGDISLGGKNEVSYQFQDGVLKVTHAQLEYDEGTKALAERLRGFPDVANPEKKAMEIVAKAGVYMDLAENPDAHPNPEKIHGLDQWVNGYSKELEAHGIELRDDGLALTENFDKQAAIAKVADEQHRAAVAAQENANLQHWASNRRGKDF